MDQPPILEIKDATKRFGGAVALSGARLAVREGTIHGVVGPNGAGKSTMLRIASGQEQPDAGAVMVNGTTMKFRAPADALAAGVAVLPQELTVVADLSVEENVTLGCEPRRAGIVDARSRGAKVRTLLERIGVEVDLRAPVGDLDPPHQRIVMLARALFSGARVLFLDEPTATLSTAEAEVLLRVVEAARDSGTSIVYVSHRFAEVNRLCEEVTVLRDGRTVDVLAGERLSVDALVEAVVVDERPETSAAERAVGTVAPPVVLEADAVVGRRLRGVSVAVRAGEILGVCGLNGSGVDELLDILGGSIRARSGTVRVRGSDVTWRSPADAHRHGVAFMPAERSRAGMLELPIRQNLRLGGGSGVARMFTTAGHERARAVSALEPFGLAHRADEPLRALSGGNRQKVLMARCLEIADVALVINNPTVGVDLKARADIHDLVRRGAGEGRAVVLTSSEPEELIALADRVLVITRGAVSSELSGDNMTLAALVRSLTVEAVGA